MTTISGIKLKTENEYSKALLESVVIVTKVLKEDPTLEVTREAVGLRLAHTLASNTSDLPTAFWLGVGTAMMFKGFENFSNEVSNVGVIVEHLVEHTDLTKDELQSHLEKLWESVDAGETEFEF